MYRQTQVYNYMFFMNWFNLFNCKITYEKIPYGGMGKFFEMVFVALCP